MEKKIIVIFLFPLVFFGGFYMSKTLLQSQVTITNSEKEQCQLQLQEALKARKKASDQDLNLYVKKVKALENIVESKVYFSQRTTQVATAKKEIIITLVGGGAMKADASDLVLRYTDNLKVLEILPGQAFPTYPRKINADGVITITGIALLNDNGVVFGEPNRVFATLIVEKMGDSKQKGVLSVDKTNTMVYLQEKSILDQNATFSQIEL